MKINRVAVAVVLLAGLGLIAMEHAAIFAARLLRLGLHTPVALNLSRRRPPSPEQTPDPAGA